MAEQEIAKHTKKVVQVLGDREHGIAHKLREMALEIVTIVFAVTLSIWLHGLSEHSHQQKEVRSFLLGLKEDIKRDLNQINDIVATDRTYDANLAYLAGLDPAKAPDPEKFEQAYITANSNFFFTPALSRYEGFKSSGKLTNIENEQLLADILSLYQTLVPEIGNSEGGWRTRQRWLRDYLELELDYGDDIGQRYKLLAAPKGKRILKRLVHQAQLYDRYEIYSHKARQVIAAIDAAYPGA